MLFPAPRHPAGHDRHRAPRQRAEPCCRCGADGTPNYNLAIPVLLAHYLPSGLLGLGLTALMACFMSGMAGNVTAFNTVWTYDIYQSYIKPGQSDKHYLRMGHAATVFGILFSVAARVRRDAIQQHHGHAAAGVRVRERPAVRHLPARHVLAPSDRARRILRPAPRYHRRGHSSRPGPARRAHRSGSRAAASARCCTPIRARWPRTSGPRSLPGPPASS